MKGNTMSSLPEKQSRPTVSIIYDNFFFAEKANAIFHGAAHSADPPGQWNVRPSRLDGIKLTSEAVFALTEAVDARLIVFAGPRAQSLPFWLEEWLEKWAACRRVKDAAFAVIGGRNGEALTMPMRPELFHFAKKHGLNFFVNEYFGVERGLKFVPPGNFKEGTPGSRMNGSSIVSPTYSSYRHWGINE